MTETKAELKVKEAEALHMTRHCISQARSQPIGDWLRTHFIKEARRYYTIARNSAFQAKFMGG
jgi:hypothetical protein